jgi:hypothetical protein
MISSKIWACTGLCWLLALPLASTQNIDISKPATPKWEFGLRGGAGFNASHIERRFMYTLQGSGSPQFFSERPRYNREYYLGGYATRFLSPRWSLRSELSILSTSYNGPALTVGLFPRYKLTNWLSLEAGFEASHALSNWGRNGVRGSLGAEIGWKNIGFNVRFSPSYSPPSMFGRGGWHNTLQVGMSYKLSKLSKLANGKK